MVGGDFDGFQVVKCDRDNPTLPKTLNLPKREEDENLKFWSFFQMKLVQLNETTAQYIKKEINSLNISEKVLGVLIRGTDYTKTKPYGHPVQPTVDEVLQEIERCILTKAYNAVYLATEEERIFNKVKKHLELSCPVLSNKRHYYDKIFYERDYDWVAQVQFSDGGSYEKGVEYLSSLYILSHCGGFVAGDCGGSGYVMTLPHRFRDIYIFDKGHYGIPEANT